MPKIKTSKSASKRFKVTATGKLIARSTVAQHLVRRKSKRTLRSSGEAIVLADADTKRMKRLIPNAK